ncbi:FecR family protein [Pseudoxanthomonas putridarboris]|uniref:FecR domain-containing protein n=1 Tax=Pseudoxanthomonas putridarboris TaxID=752605 RepID=A0ABU9J338_9GAMM
MTQRETSTEIDAEAARWVALMDRGPLSADDSARLQAWLDGDSRRAGAFAKARAVNIQVDRAAARRPGRRAIIGQEDGTASRRPATWRRRGAMAAALASCLVVGVVYQNLAGRISTNVGASHRTTLSDRSVVTLNTASTVKPVFDKHHRRVVLIKGEALFDVAKDASRPFIVDAGDVEVVAIGTSFVVKRLEGSPVSVIVREGTVEVVRSGDKQVRRLEAGHKVEVSRKAVAAIQPISGRDQDAALAWMRGKISLSRMRLDQAVAEIGRYNAVPIRIRSESLKEQRISGLFSTTDPEGFARAAALSLGGASGTDAEGIWIDSTPER